MEIADGMQLSGSRMRQAEAFPRCNMLATLIQRESKTGMDTEFLTSQCKQEAARLA